MFACRLLCFIAFMAAFDGLKASKLPPFFKSYNQSDGQHSVSALEDPCGNFFGYSCNNWIAQTTKPSFEPVWSPWIAVAHKIKQRLTKILSHRNPALAKSRMFYSSCLDIVNDENKYLEEMIFLVDNLGGWPLVDRKWKHVGTYDWLRHLSKITSIIGIHPILKISADLDYNDPSKMIIYIEPGDLIFPEHILTGTGHNLELELYEKWIMETAVHVYANATIDNYEVKQMVKLERNLADIINLTKRQNVRKTVKDLYKVYPVDWVGTLKIMFGKYTEITSDTVVAVKHFKYLKSIFPLITKMGDRIVADYLIWSVIKDLSRDTTHHLRNLNFLIDQAILGVQDDLSREHECIDKVIQYFSPLLVPPYVKMFVNPQSFGKVISMVDSIKTEFVNILLKNTWLSKEGKILTAEKVKNIQLHLGYPLESFARTHKLYTRNHETEVTTDHFLNIIKLKKLYTKQKLKRISNKKAAVLWPSSPFDVNAYYSILQNSIFIPLGLLDSPFFHYNRPDVLNYGALGSLIGHEISHALDSTGILADKTGKIDQWLPNRDLEMYKNRTGCFGTDHTVAENIADINGVKISLAAVEKPTRTSEFFISFAQMWCEISENMDILTGDEHAHVAHRVQNLRKNREFMEAFNCSVSDSCTLW